MKKQNGTTPARQRKQAINEAEWLRVREFERRLSALPMAEQEALLKQLSFEEVYALFCATVARNAEDGRSAEAQ